MLSKIPILSFLHHYKMLNFDANPLQLDIWLQSYEGFDRAKNKIKQMNLNTVFANISKTTSPTSDSFLPLDHVTYVNSFLWLEILCNQRP